MTPILVDTAAAATYLGIRPAAMRQRAHRWRLTRYGTRMRAAYDLREIETRARDTPPRTHP